MTGAEWMVKTLRERGVEVVFLLCGNGIKPFLDACVEGNMPVVDTRNEQAAAYMADAWGRMAALRPIPVVDSLLAATALVHRLTLVTRNDRHLAGLGADVLNPFEMGDSARPRSATRTASRTGNSPTENTSSAASTASLAVWEEKLVPFVKA